MNARQARDNQALLVEEIRRQLETCPLQIQAIEEDIAYGVDRRQRERTGARYTSSTLWDDNIEEFEALHRALDEVVQQVEFHRANLWYHANILTQMDRYLAQVEHNQPQQQAVPAPAHAPAPAPALAVAAATVRTPAGSFSAPPATQRPQRYERRYACPICNRDYDRRLAVESHGWREHGQQVQAVDAPSRPRN